ncbi:alpha-L-fucosidase [Flagellimonas zhangzhouensis]|uniref:alpha-L-fucosidase n=1 Tax=Flagellimonas zhangzhouensis TaxID=1073328 RepID=A0A1H2RR79_9FLAO|nr:alpha-L-fucosidase [Allomuricauda zhangzhouensis]SDQ66969.1 alpha-L-fucosidase [Allomuricauda zhangzhouensis]SDW21966.1 alpha-L-fucosidase [Allomuricauda zhangzhouensis]
MKKYFALVFMALLFANPSISQDYQPSPENLKNREWYQDAKFGLFIHWGVYSVLGVHEWVMETQGIDVATYEKLPAFFNPTEFDAEAWVLMAKNAGMKYITITTKHHDGFAMFNSKLSDWDIMDRTVYKKDVIKQMAEACRKHDMKLFLYYSQLDWHHNDYYPRGDTGKKSGRPDKGNWEDYLDYMNGQLTELLTNYGEIGGIWFDGWWDKKEADWQLRKTYDLIHELQPQAMIGSNHHQTPNPGEDFQMFERDLPGQNKGGYSGEATVGKLPLETAETMAHQWGFSLQDKSYKSTKELIQYLVKAAGHNGNFLLNVGPMPNGKIQPEFIATLKEIGDWTSTYGESIYETRGGQIAPQSWGVSTQKDDKIYIHIMDWKTDNFFFPTVEGKITSVVDFQSKKKLKHNTNSYGTLVELPKNRDYDQADFVLVVQLK